MSSGRIASVFGTTIGKRSAVDFGEDTSTISIGQFRVTDGVGTFVLGWANSSEWGIDFVTAKLDGWFGTVVGVEAR